MSRAREPRIAHVDEYDSDESDIRPGTKVYANRHASMQVQVASRRSDQPHPSQSSRGRERSSTALPRVSQQQPLPVSRRSSTPAVPPAQDRPRASALRNESQTRRVQVHPPQGMPRSNSGCGIPNCTDPRCAAVQFGHPHSTSTQQQMPPYPRPPSAAGVPIAQGMSSFAATPVYGYGPQPRMRTSSFSQPRPTSWAYPTEYQTIPQPLPAAPQRGPPPAQSAWTNLPDYGYRQPATYTMGQPVGDFNAQPQPALDTMMAGLSISRPSSSVYSARTPHGQTSYPTFDSSLTSQRPMTSRTVSMSARRADNPHPMPGSFPGESAVDDVHYPGEYSSESDQDGWRSKRDSKMMPPPPRPPMPRATQTTPNLPTRTRSVRETRYPARPSDGGIDYLRHDAHDPERTPRPSTSRRQSSAHSSSRSRRPSVSDASSGGRTKATTISSGSGSRALIDDRDGRRREVHPREIIAEREAEALAYIRNAQGQQSTEVTLDDIRQQVDRNTPYSRSRASGHSRKSGKSGSRDEGVRFDFGDTSMKLGGNSHLEVCMDESGRPERIIVTPGGRDNGSAVSEPKSAGGSRSRRSRVGSDRGSISREPIAEVKET